jgi:hypothetical protein
MVVRFCPLPAYSLIRRFERLVSFALDDFERIAPQFHVVLLPFTAMGIIDLLENTVLGLDLSPSRKALTSQDGLDFRPLFRIRRFAGNDRRNTCTRGK